MKNIEDESFNIWIWNRGAYSIHWIHSMHSILCKHFRYCVFLFLTDFMHVKWYFDIPLLGIYLIGLCFCIISHVLFTCVLGLYLSHLTVGISFYVCIWMGYLYSVHMYYSIFIGSKFAFKLLLLKNLISFLFLFCYFS